MTSPRYLLSLGLAAFLLAGCQLEQRTDEPVEARPVTPTAVTNATVYGGSEPAPTDADIEAGRRYDAWRGFATRDTEYPRSLGRPVTSDSARTDGTQSARQRDRTRPLRADTTAYASAMEVPLSGNTDGRSVLYAQILLDRAGFSPGQIDGAWGQNTEKAIYWLQRSEGLDATGQLDRRTLRRLAQLADAPRSPDSLLQVHTLTAEDVEGPFEKVPDDIYAQAEMDRLGYASLAEKLGERFHVAPSLLREWHGSAVDSLAAGDTLRVPNLRQHSASGIDRLVVSDGGRYLHALDAQGAIVYHFPATLGSDYDPSPSDTLEITSVTENPGWHYQPKILANVDDNEEDAQIPPGPNNAVGAVWMALSKEHYGIHGTAHPETIGHTASAGCVRLTNWDAQLLAQHVGAGTEVAFRDMDGRDPMKDRRPAASDSTASDSTAVRP